MRTSEKLDEISPALVGASRVLKNPPKDAKGQVRGRQDYAYLSLPALIEAVRKPLAEVGLTFVQSLPRVDGGVEAVTRLIHLSGQWIEFDGCFMPATGGAQEWGSADTYARRYSLAAALGIAADEDDDGRKAQNTGAARATAPVSGSASAPTTMGTSGGETAPSAGPCTKCGSVQTFIAGRFIRCRDCGHAEPRR